METAQDRPFILSSGIASPVYINVRRVISYPAIREMLMGFATEILDAEIGRDRIDAVAGAGLAGLVIEAGKVMILDRDTTLQAARNKGIFLVASEL